MTYFGRGNEHVRRLLVPTHRGDRRMQRCGDVLRPPVAESDDIWIDPKWKTTKQAS
jgi:hypothetical protein